MNQQRKHVAVVGATGAVGQNFLQVLERRGFPLRSLKLLASARSAGKTMRFAGEDLVVEPLTESSLRGVEIALFSAGGAVAREWAPRAVSAGAVVVDNSSAFRMVEGVPLIVPEINAADLASHRGIVANPNCSTIILCLALGPLHRTVGVKRVVVSTYQAASGAGQRAMEELRAGSAAHLAGREPVVDVLPHSLAFNLFPQVDVFLPEGYTKEEDKMLFETRKILSAPRMEVEATCVRVPVERSHSESVAVELGAPLTPDAARALFRQSPGLVVEDIPEDRVYPMPKTRSGKDEVAVGRIRKSRVFTPGLAFWLSGDQLLKGAALNAVQIAELL